MNCRFYTTLLTTILVAPLILYSIPAATSQPNYSEEVSITVIGNSVYWTVNMQGGNITLPGLSQIEAELKSTSGYQLLTLNPSRWTPEFEPFSGSGFDIIGFKSIPESGILLNVDSQDQGEARRLADSLSRSLKLSFISFDSSPGVYTFYSHVEFSRVVGGDLWRAVPVWYNGSSTLVDKDSFLSEDVPIFKFSSRRVGEGFLHTVSTGGLRKSAVIGRMIDLDRILLRFNATAASSHASSSLINIRVIGSLVASSNFGEVRNFPENRSSTVTVSAKPGEVFPDVSVSPLQGFPSIIATRSVDRASVKEGDVVSIGIRIRNIAPVGSAAAENLTVKEDWWRKNGQFELVDGEVERVVERLGRGEYTLAYRLRLKTSVKGEAMIPASSITYSYPAANTMVKESARLNQATLILNDIRPALSIEASIASSTPPILSVTPVNLTVKNYGNGHAINVRVADSFRQSLLAGDSWILPLNISSSLRDVTLSPTWSVSWDEEGERREAGSNSVKVNYNVTGVSIPTFNLARLISTVDSNGEAKVVDIITVSNTGSGSLGRIVLRERLPEGLTFINGTYTLGEDGILSAEARDIKAGGSGTYSYSARLASRDESYIVPPIEVSVEASGLKMSRLARSEVIPLGVKVFKIFDHNADFVTGSIAVRLGVVNRGSLPVFDVTVELGSDPFTSLVEGAATLKKEMLEKGEALNSTVKVLLVRPGSFNTSKAVASFTIAGHSASQSSDVESISVYSPISAEVTIAPQIPIEGRSFTATLTVKNPSNLPVQDVEIKVDLPPQIRVLDGSLQLTASELSANASTTSSATLLVGSPAEISVKPPEVSFKYLGQVFRGASKGVDITVGDDLTARYGLPLTVALLISLATVFLARRATRTGSAQKS